MQSPDSPTPPTSPRASISPTSPTVKRLSSNHARQASISASGSGSQWRREEREPSSINGTSGDRLDSYSPTRLDGYPSRHESFAASRPDGVSSRQDSYSLNKSPTHTRTGSGDIREAREREKAREPNKLVRTRAPTAPPGPIKPSSSPIQEKDRGPEKLVKSRSKRDREREREKERELSRRTSQAVPSAPSSTMTDTRAEQDSLKGVLNSNSSTRRARPTSEVVVESTEQLKAQGAWEHARMVGMRGQSVVMPDNFAVAPPPPQRTSSRTQGQYQPPAGSPPPQYPHSHQHQNGHPPRTIAGSLHTQLVVQQPFQQQAQSQQQLPPRQSAWPAYQYRQYAYYPVQQRQTQPVDPNPLPTPPAQINYPPQRVNR
jgi:hypothetical protein